MATYPVKYLHSEMRGAPTLSGSAGALIGVLDACLTTGFGLTSVTALSVSSGVATATVGSGNSFEVGAIVLIDGATPGTLNGEQRVTASTATTFTFATAAADGAATGTISAKYAPAHDWEKTYSGTNKAVYRSVNLEASGHYLRVDDTGTQTAAVRGYVAMSDVDTGTGPFPTTAQMSTALWVKSMQASGTAVRWMFFADARFFGIAIAPYSYSNATYLSAPLRGFGDAIGLADAGDVWATVLSCCNSADQWVRGSLDSPSVRYAIQGTNVFARSITGTGSAKLAVLGVMAPFSSNSSSFSGAETSGFGAFPSGVDGKLRLASTYLREDDSDSAPRALVPGTYYAPWSGVASYFTSGDVLPGSDDFTGKRLIAVGAGNSGFSPNGMYFMDATGPWR